MRQYLENYPGTYPTYIHIYVYTHTYMYMYILTHIRITHVHCRYQHTYIHTYIHTHIRTYVSINFIQILREFYSVVKKFLFNV